jgi:hypothetical protein
MTELSSQVGRRRLTAIAGQVRLAAGGLGIAEADAHRAPVFEDARELAVMADDCLERIVIVSAASRVVDHGMVSFQNRAATTKAAAVIAASTTGRRWRSGAVRRWWWWWFPS